jgi:hypothetical protein
VSFNATCCVTFSIASAIFSHWDLSHYLQRVARSSWPEDYFSARVHQVSPFDNPSLQIKLHWQRDTELQ